MSKEKREAHTYEANGPVPQQLGACFALGVPAIFQRVDTGASVYVRVRSATHIGEGNDAVVRFQGTLLRANDGEAVIGEYNVATGHTVLTTWVEL